MPAIYKLSVMKLRSLPEGKFNDGAGLWYQKYANGNARWFLRYVNHGRRHEMSLGSAHDVSLKEARELASKWRGVLKGGKDPLKERERLTRQAAREDNTLRRIAEEAFEAYKPSLRADGVAGRWFSPLELHVLPKLGRVPIEEIDQRDIRDTLAPLWHTKADTARKAMNRLNIVMNYAAALGLNVDVQAVPKAKALLGQSRHKARHIPAVPWQEVPEFYASLRDNTVTHLALRLLILTALRSKPIRFCRVDQIKDDVWTVPAENMKARQGKEAEFRVPLSGEALELIEAAKPHTRDGFLFPNVRRGVISDATMSRYMERQRLEARPHGFRSSFRTWCAEATTTPREIAEAALAHSSGSVVEDAYRRSDYLDKRRSLMESWARFVTDKGESDIVKLGERLEQRAK